MSDSVLSGIVERVFNLGVASVSRSELGWSDTPMALQELWAKRIAYESTRPRGADDRPPEPGHAHRLFVWLQPREPGQLSFVWFDLPNDDGQDRNDYFGADWRPIETLADWSGRLLNEPV